MDESTRVLPANQFRHYCLHDVTRAERILDLLFESDRTLPEILEKHLVIIRDYLTGGETFEKFAREGILPSVRMMRKQNSFQYKNLVIMWYVVWFGRISPSVIVVERVQSIHV